MPKCAQCGRYMSPIEQVLGAVCGDCCRENQARATGRRRSYTTSSKTKILIRIVLDEEPDKIDINNVADLLDDLHLKIMRLGTRWSLGVPNVYYDDNIPMERWDEQHGRD